MKRTYCVYILASRSRVLYVGVSNNLVVRVAQHREERPKSFTTRYRVHRLVYFEVFSDVRAAIAREKELKHWTRAQKITLIEKKNPTWEDLVERYLGKAAARAKRTADSRAKAARE